MNTPRRKGFAFGAQVVGFLQKHGVPQAERRVMGGSRDRGDMAGVPGWVLELKATKALDLASALSEAQREAGNAGVSRYAAILKRRQHGVADSYVVIPLHLFAGLVAHCQQSTDPMSPEPPRMAP